MCYDQPLMSLAEAAEYLGVSVCSLERALRSLGIEEVDGLYLKEDVESVRRYVKSARIYLGLYSKEAKYRRNYVRPMLERAKNYLTRTNKNKSRKQTEVKNETEG